MDTGGPSQMARDSLTSSPPGLGMPLGGLASRRGGAQNIKTLSIDAAKSQTETGSGDNGAPTPRTSRLNLLQGLRTAPKTATGSTFPSSPTIGPSTQTQGRNSISGGLYGNGPKTSVPRMSTQRHQSVNQQSMGFGQQQYTAEQVLAPPKLVLDERVQEQMDPNTFAQLLATNVFLAQQQQQLQQQLYTVQAAAQQFQTMNMNGQAAMQQNLALQNLYQQQQQLQGMQQSIFSDLHQAPLQRGLRGVMDSTTGQVNYFIDQNIAQPQFQAQAQGQVQMQMGRQLNSPFMEQPSTPQPFTSNHGNIGAPRVQVSPPPNDSERHNFLRTKSPPKRLELTAEPVPLPPPSANAFRRGHKKLSSMADDSSTVAGPKSAGLPLSSLPNGYRPGQGRAGEHPFREPRGPPAIDELRSKPTTKHEGSKNFATQARRFAVDNVKAGLHRRRVAGGSGSNSPVSETAEEVAANESDSGRSGSGSLSGDAELSLNSSRTSTSGSWGAIGSDRPTSRQKSRKSVDSHSSIEMENEVTHKHAASFASVFKSGQQQCSSKPSSPDGHRKATMAVLTSAEKRKGSIAL